MTLPRLFMTLPYRTQQKMVSVGSRFWAATIFSIMALLIPIALMGFTALSVLRATTRRTPAELAASQTFWEPTAFVWRASPGYCSQAGTCFSAAAWNT